MKQVNSISGGATSNFMYIHYPAKHNIFSCVLIEDERAAPKDKGLLKAVREKIPGFIASAEADLTLKNLLDLEDKYGREIIWTNGPTFDKVVQKRKMLPNRVTRFCTYEMKMLPIFNYCLSFIMKGPADMVLMPIGIRADEQIREVKLMASNKNGLKVPYLSMLDTASKKWKYPQKHKTYHWRELSFPLIRDGITKPQIMKYWQKEKVAFPSESNCAGCFFKVPRKLKQQWKNYPATMQWFADQEKEMGGTFRPDGSYNDFKNLPDTLFPLEENTLSFDCNCTD